MTEVLQAAVETLVRESATAESHTVTLRADAYVAELATANPRSAAVEDAIDALAGLDAPDATLTRSALTGLLRECRDPAKLALIFAWGSGNWALWCTHTRLCLEQVDARSDGFSANVDAIAFLLDGTARFTEPGSTRRARSESLTPYDAFAKLWSPSNFRQALVPYAGTAFGTKLLYFAARIHHVDGVKPLIYDKRVAKSLQALGVRWSGDGKSGDCFRLPTEVMPFACYDAYCHWCAEVATRLSDTGLTLEDGRSPTADDIEYWLWAFAGDIEQPVRIKTARPGTADDPPAGLDADEPEQPPDEPPAAAKTVKQAARQVLSFCRSEQAEAVCRR